MHRNRRKFLSDVGMGCTGLVLGSLLWHDGIAKQPAPRATPPWKPKARSVIWLFMAGGGIKGGIVHGATDELGILAAVDRHYVTDIHATVLHQLGLDSRQLEIPGRKRLEIEHGRPIREIIA